MTYHNAPDVTDDLPLCLPKRLCPIRRYWHCFLHICLPHYIILSFYKCFEYFFMWVVKFCEHWSFLGNAITSVTCAIAHMTEVYWSVRNRGSQNACNFCAFYYSLKNLTPSLTYIYDSLQGCKLQLWESILWGIFSAGSHEICTQHICYDPFFHWL